MNRYVLGLALLASISPVGAMAQNVPAGLPAITSTTTWTAAQWITAFQSYVNTSGGTATNLTLAGTPLFSGSQTQSYVLAAPTSAAGAPIFRALVPGDISGLTAAAVTPVTTIATSGTSQTISFAR